MLQTLSNLVVEALGDRTIPIAIAVVVAGVFVWLLGARFSKSILALFGAGLGAWVGTHLPRWFGWNFDGMALGMGGALVLGLAGYLLHTTWLGGALLVNLSFLFALTAWALMAGDASWNPPAVSSLGSTQTEILRSIWRTLPGDLPRVMPFAVAGGAISAVAIAVLWPRIAHAASWSLIGLVLIACAGGVAVSVRWPGERASLLPTAAGARVALVWGLAMAGTLVQWWALSGREAAAPAAAPKPAAPPAGLATGGAEA